jgi:hypothetical protein
VSVVTSEQRAALLPPCACSGDVGSDSDATRRSRTPAADASDALGPAPRAELLHVLILPDFERADAIGSYWGNPKTRTFAELLIDCEEDRVLRAVLVGMLREMERR